LESWKAGKLESWKAGKLEARSSKARRSEARSPLLTPAARLTTSPDLLLSQKSRKKKPAIKQALYIHLVRKKD